MHKLSHKCMVMWLCLALHDLHRIDSTFEKHFTVILPGMRGLGIAFVGSLRRPHSGGGGRGAHGQL